MFAGLLVGRHDLPQGSTVTSAFGGTSSLPELPKSWFTGNSHLESISPNYDLAAAGFYLSGGTSNADPNLSIGGQISTTEFRFQTFNQLSPLAGVTIVRLGNSSIGTGVLSYEKVTDGYRFKWVPSGSSTLASRLIPGSGKYGILTSNGVANGYCVVDVDWYSLDPAGDSCEVIVENVTNNLFSALTPTQAATGYTSYRCIYIKNEHQTKTLKNLSLGLHRDTATGSLIALAPDFAGAGDGINTGIATTPIDETADPSLNFADNINLPDLLPGQCTAFWFRRTMYLGWFKELNPDVHLLLLEGSF